MTLEEIALAIPKDWNEKKELSENLEQIFLDYINRTQLDPIDAILELCDEKNVRIEDIEDYIPQMRTLLSIIYSKENKQDNFKGLF